MPYTHPNFDGALAFGYFSNKGPLEVGGPGQVAPLPPLSATLVVGSNLSMVFSM